MNTTGHDTGAHNQVQAFDQQQIQDSETVMTPAQAKSGRILVAMSFLFIAILGSTIFIISKYHSSPEKAVTVVAPKVHPEPKEPTLDSVKAELTAAQNAANDPQQATLALTSTKRFAEKKLRSRNAIEATAAFIFARRCIPEALKADQEATELFNTSVSRLLSNTDLPMEMGLTAFWMSRFFQDWWKPDRAFIPVVDWASTPERTQKLVATFGSTGSAVYFYYDQGTVTANSRGILLDTDSLVYKGALWSPTIIPYVQIESLTLKYSFFTATPTGVNLTVNGQHDIALSSVNTQDVESFVRHLTFIINVARHQVGLAPIEVTIPEYEAKRLAEGASTTERLIAWTSEKAGSISDTLYDYGGKATTWITDNPGKAVGIAAATLTTLAYVLDGQTNIQQPGQQFNGVSSPPNALLLNDNTYSRPSGYRKGVRDEVWNKAIEAPTNQVRDPVTGLFMSPEKPWDMGHLPGYEFSKHQQSAATREITRKQFLDEHNDPTHYRPELPSSNRSHVGEDKTGQYLGQ